jgi:hypothetical protein
VRGDPELKAAQDTFMELLSKMRVDNRPSFLAWTQKISLGGGEATKPVAPPVPQSQQVGAPSTAAVAAKDDTVNSNVHVG